MKHIVATIIAFYCICCCNAQVLPVDSFYVTGAEWRDVNMYAMQWTGAGSSKVDTSGYSFLIDKDTIVGGETYQHLSYKYLGGHTTTYSSTGGFSSNYSDGSGAIYQPLGRLYYQHDSLWFINDYIDPQQLVTFAYYYVKGVPKYLRRFNLNIGDSASGSGISGIDSVAFGSEMMRRHLLQGGSYFLNGIGGQKGLLSYVPDKPAGDVYSVCYQKGNTVYHFNPSVINTPLQQNCYELQGMGIAEGTAPNTRNVICYPTLLRDGRLNYKTFTNIDLKGYHIVNSAGQITAAGTLHPGTHGQIICDLPEGIYQIIFEGRQGVTATVPFTIE